MDTLNTYVAYKRDTRHLLYWMIHASNSIVKSLAGSTEDGDGPSMTLNTSGKTTVSDVVSMSKLIAKHIDPIPPLIYRLFLSIIEARTTCYTVFQQTVTKDPDPEVEKSNKSHKYFIDALTEAFKALGGETWELNQKSRPEKPQDEETIEEVIFSNRFSSLSLDEQEEDENETEGNVELGQQTPPILRTQGPRKQPRPGKGKKNKNAKKSKKQKPAKVQESDLDSVPLESYRIIEDGFSTMTDYLMAVYAIWKEWAELRLRLQNTWHEVAYEGLNSAVAGELSNLAVAMIKRTESAIFCEFPGHDSYETVMQTIARGDVDEERAKFRLNLYEIDDDTTHPVIQTVTSGNLGEVQATVKQLIYGTSKDSQPKMIFDTIVDLKEQLMVHTYRSLLDFVTDYQKTRSGKPTKSLMAEIRHWDPNFDLQRATAEQRLRWRRSYTINWLYDLVNLYSSIAVQQNKTAGANHAYENVDWSASGELYKFRRLFGLNEFAGVVTSLAMQKPGTDIRKRILPHLVFQLQCIVDSMTVARGWYISSFRGHVLKLPAKGFRPTRDIDLFRDNEEERPGHGFLHAIPALKEQFEIDTALHQPNRHEFRLEMLKNLRRSFVTYLGESRFIEEDGDWKLSPSRFSDTDPNGLWEYSPFLCGVGLMEALEYAHVIGMYVWDQVHEAMLLVHLHNMLVKKGYISEPINVFRNLEIFFPTEFFPGGKTPSSNFHKTLLKSLQRGRHRVITDEPSLKIAFYGYVGMNEALNPEKNQYFKTKPLPLVLREADWNLERIPEKDIDIASHLCCLRLNYTKRSVDPTTGKRRLEDTDLVRRLRVRAHGSTDEDMIRLSQSMWESLCRPLNQPRLRGNAACGRYIEALMSDLHKRTGTVMASDKGPGGTALVGRDLLIVMKWDTFSAVCGNVPVLGFNYISALENFMKIFTRIEDELKRLRNPLYVKAYETQDPLNAEKRVGLTTLAMLEQDDECLRVMADILQKTGPCCGEYIYWRDVENIPEAQQKSHKQEVRLVKEVGPDRCVVM
ncbi:hypothetical protein F5Y04DRAFT_290860 [Hypomontagnella monticulosa]|nr:hypothetical protein F5Y04DRAFT_290860 [Hypomontagnella monticulosa]